MTAPVLDPQKVAEVTGQDLAIVERSLAELSAEDQPKIGAMLDLDCAPTGAKRGRPTSPRLDLLRELHPALSPRSITRLDRALRLLYANSDPATVPGVIGLYTRANGTIRVAALEAHADFVTWCTDPAAPGGRA